MKIVHAYLRYIKDNPEHYWFKRKVYGWGWTPATREGWLTTIIFVIFVLTIAWRAETSIVTPEDAVLQLVLPVLVGVIIFLIICWKTGEPPKWQWQLPKKYFED